MHSSAKHEDDRGRRQKKIDKAITQLEELTPKLNAYHLKTQKEIKTAVDRICKPVKEFIDVDILTERKPVKIKLSPPRTSVSKSVFKNKWTFTYDIEWKLNEKALAEASGTDGIFPLITNTAFDAADVLKRYKEQPFLEKRMYTQKTVLEVAPVFLKKVKRIEAMLFPYFVALMVVSLIERKIRMHMAKEKIEKLPILPQGMNTKKPTWNNIRYFYRNIHFSEMIRDGIPILSEVKGLSTLHNQINRLLEVPKVGYETLNGRWWQFVAI